MTVSGKTVLKMAWVCGGGLDRNSMLVNGKMVMHTGLEFIYVPMETVMKEGSRTV